MPAVVRAREDSVRTARPSRALLMSALTGASPGALGDPGTTFVPHPHPHNRDALGDRDALGATQTQLAHCCFAAAFWEARMTLWAAIWNSPERACDNGSTVPRRIEAAPLPWFPRANRSPVASQWQPELGTLSESKGEAITSEHEPGQDLPSSSFTCFHQGAGSTLQL
ncbi:uncharacterized protein [Tursiops truncatus]|uniref:uncharacterized protein isoform X3 n=1 Tax=Tursiops truncatus TaxID=9739 RepID=UPI003CCF59CE